MNDIEILEEFIKRYKEVQEKYKDDKIQAEIERSCYFEEVPAQAIENLIQRNKELEEKYKFLIQNNLDDKYEEVLEKVFKKYIDKDFIPKSKIKEILNKNRDGDLYGFMEAYNSLRDDLEKILEGE